MAHDDMPAVIVDTREQNPLDLAMPNRRGTLGTGDYSMAGFETKVAIERKSLPDLVSSLTWQRERFLREVERLEGFPVRAIVVEASMADALAGAYHSHAQPWAVIASTLAIVARGVPVVWAGDREMAARCVEWLLSYSWKRRVELGLVEAAEQAA